MDFELKRVGFGIVIRDFHSQVVVVFGSTISFLGFGRSGRSRGYLSRLAVCN
ncbi:hypothetical protein ACOSQ2_009695 [Xanthoceras sorbifolium]